MPKNGIKAVVFDLDGTLINSTVDFTAMRRRIIDYLASFGIPAKDLDRNDSTIRNLERTKKYLVERGRDSDIAWIEIMTRNIMNDVEMEGVASTTLIDGVVPTLEELKGKGLRLAVLTRGSRSYALSSLQVSGIADRFEAIVCRDDFPESEAKPNGKAMQRVADQLHLAVEDCILLGDHEIDFQCARSSGARFVGVLSGAYSKRDWSRLDCEVIDSVAGIGKYLDI